MIESLAVRNCGLFKTGSYRNFPLFFNRKKGRLIANLSRINEKLIISTVTSSTMEQRQSHRRKGILKISPDQ
jgi:hypothetical protein